MHSLEVVMSEPTAILATDKSLVLDQVRFELQVGGRANTPSLSQQFLLALALLLPGGVDEVLDPVALLAQVVDLVFQPVGVCIVGLEVGGQAGGVDAAGGLHAIHRLPRAPITDGHDGGEGRGHVARHISQGRQPDVRHLGNLFAARKQLNLEVVLGTIFYGYVHFDDRVEERGLHLDGSGSGSRSP